ncbi:MAG: hypothetical protein JWO11_426 [Nocardioides sp.]|nr:hypothetical protein [Nocardioides sp.]
MPALPNSRDTLQGLVSRTEQSVATASAALRKALARLVSNGGRHQGPERRTR